VMSCGREQLADILDTLNEIFDAPPIESLDWVRRTVNAEIDLMVVVVGNDLQTAADKRQAGTPLKYHSALQDKAAMVRREIEIKLGKIDARARLRQLTPPIPPATFEADLFISYASEDCAAVAEPLARELSSHGYKVWLDQFVLKLGDRLLDKIDEGIA